MEALTVLGDVTRRRIVELLAERERPAGEIADHFAVSGPAISRHLRVLRTAGIAEYRRDGQRWVYRLNPEPLIAADEWMRHNIAAWERRFQALGGHLDAMAAAERADVKGHVP
jgi:DNA-binding transcriptional ArsR family regulator